MRRFNVTGHCVPSEDYMVDTGSKIEKIVQMVDDRQYFTINRARQYGKTTTLALLGKNLRDRYVVASISFEGVGDRLFDTEELFCVEFKDMLSLAFEFSTMANDKIEKWDNTCPKNFRELSREIAKLCKEQKVVLLIDEVDKVSDNKIFLHFLGMLRNKFLSRKNSEDYTFHSVILAGVHDIKNIKLKLIREGKYVPSAGEGSYNSPWNIAVDFEVDMSFQPGEIETMLKQYEDEHTTDMDLCEIAKEIFDYSSGYPYLVSRICQRIDEKLDRDWSISGVRNAVKMILAEKNTLFDDISKNFENNSELYEFVYDILVVGDSKSFQIDNPIIDLGVTFGIFKHVNGRVAVSNKIFELRIYNYFISKDESTRKKQITGVLQYDIVQNDRFDMELCLRKFAQHYHEIFDYEKEEDVRFLERHGRMVFLSYLKPLINGKGFYHMESQFTDLRRMDLVVDYGMDQFILELKLWRGEIEHEKAYDQLLGYLESTNASVGYLLTFDFRKAGNKQRRAEWVEIAGKRIFDVII